MTFDENDFPRDIRSGQKYSVVLKMPVDRELIIKLNEDVERLGAKVPSNYFIWYKHVLEYGDTFIKNDLTFVFGFKDYNDAVTFDDRWSVYEE